MTAGGLLQFYQRVLLTILSHMCGKTRPKQKQLFLIFLTHKLLVKIKEGLKNVLSVNAVPGLG